MTDGEMGRTCSMNEGDNKFIQNLSREVLREGTTWMTKEYMGHIEMDTYT
jgi:hypothetical protein